MYKYLKELVSMSHELRLLYIEGEILSRETTLLTLQNFFNNITIALDGKEGLEKFQNEEFDLIITNLNMPHLSGIEMLHTIRETNQDIPVLILSEYTNSDDILRVIELDIDGFLLKPINQELFLNALFKTVKKIDAFKMQDKYRQNLEKEVIQKNEEIMEKLHYDSLTGLLSRYSFFRDTDILDDVAVILIDINKFKVINEVYGNDTGSHVLEKFSIKLSLTVEDEKCTLYRLSGDEFAVVTTNEYQDLDKYEALIDHIFNSLNNLKLKVDGHMITVDITMGISFYVKKPYEHAKIALDFAKEKKRPFIAYSAAIDKRKESNLVLECRNMIDAAIEDNRVVAVYQPIVNKNGKVIKHETLMRLQEKENAELLTPFYFLDTAIKTRLYDYLSERVIFYALNKLTHSDHVLSVNLTYSDMKNNILANKMEMFFRKNKDIGNRVIIEITENESIENYADVKKFIARFRRYGIRIALDDFGTGFSNFEYILEIKPDYLKIDGSLVKDIDTDARAYTLVKAIVEFSHKLDIKVIAEYVHSKVIFEMLKSVNVDEYQGYYFSEPLKEIID